MLSNLCYGTSCIYYQVNGVERSQVSQHALPCVLDPSDTLSSSQKYDACTGTANETVTLTTYSDTSCSGSVVGTSTVELGKCDTFGSFYYCSATKATLGGMVLLAALAHLL
jgi:hypothetical protein